MRNLNHLSLVPVLLAAGGWSMLSAQTVTVSPSSLNLSAQYQGAPVSQQLSITSTGSQLSFTIISNANNLKVNGATAFSGTTPATVTVTFDPTGLGPNTFASSLSVFGVGSSTPVTVPVTLTVSTIGVNPTSITFQPYTQGGAIPPPQSITLSGPAGSYTAAPTTQSGGQWLSVTPTSGNVPGAVTATVNAAVLTGLAPAVYQGSITITPVGTANNPAITVPVSLTVLPTPPVKVNPQLMVFNVQQGGAGNIATQTLTISTTPGQTQNYSFTASYATGTPSFLTINPPAGNTDVTSGTAQVAIGYSLSGLTPGNSYQATLVLITPGGTPVQTSIPVTLNYTTTPVLNVPTNTLNFLYQLAGSLPADQMVSVTATDNSLMTFAIAQSANSSWLVIPNSGSTGAPFTVHVNPPLTPGTYSATINITPANSSKTQQIPVVLQVSNDPFVASNVSSMSFPFQVGQAAPAAQTFQITSSNGVTLNYSAAPATTNCGSGWLLLNGAVNAVTGATSATSPISVTIATAGLTAGTCKGAINITATNASTGVAAVNSPLSIPVTVVVDSKPMLVTLPSALSFAAPAGGQSPAPQTITLSSTSGTDVVSYTVTGVSQGGAPSTWLFASPTSGSTASGNVVTVNIFSSSLPAGSYSGSVTLAATNSGGAATANSPVVIPVSLQVTTGSITLSATSLVFNYTLGGASPPNQTLTVGSSTSNPLTFTAVATSTPTAWLSVTPTSGTTGSSGTLTVSVDGTKFTSPGNYGGGTITITSPGAGNSPVLVNVTTIVSAGTISAPATTLSFVQASGGSAPPAQTIAVTGSPAPLNFTVATSTTPAGGTWLSATPTSGTTPGNVSVSVNGSTLSVGQFTGQVVITSAGASGSPITVPIVLNVTNPATATVSPTSLSFNYVVGQTAPAAQTLTMTSSTQIPITATVQASSPGGWLQVTPTQTNAPGTISVTVQPTSLTASATPYSGTITLSSPNLLNPITVPVSLTVTAIPKPVITAVGNAASYATGPVSPGENVTIFGTGIGPATLTSNAPVNGSFGTTLGSTRVLFDGVAAPIIYASATQTSVMVPYGVNGRTSTSIVVEFAGVQSNPIAFSVSGSAPGIYTLNSQGTGPGAIINQDGVTVNGPNTPEKRGNVIAIYMTGEGQTSPAGVDGAVIPPVTSALKSPVLPVTATIGGVAVTGSAVAYAGSAPGLISGVMQVNLIIPQNAPTGAAVPIVVTVGPNSSQSGVTVAIQ